MTPTIGQLLGKQHVQDILFLLTWRFPFLALPQLTSFWHEHYGSLDPTEPRVPGSDFRRIDYDAPLGGGYDTARFELRKLVKEAGVLRTASVTVRWPAPPVLPGGRFGLPSEKELQDRKAVWDALTPRTLTVYLPTPNAAEALRPEPRLRSLMYDWPFPANELEAFFDNVKKRDAAFIAPRLYIADDVLRQWFAWGRLEAVRYSLGSGRGDWHAVGSPNHLQCPRQIYFAPVVTRKEADALWAVAGSRLANPNMVNVEVR